MALLAVPASAAPAPSPRPEHPATGVGLSAPPATAHGATAPTRPGPQIPSRPTDQFPLPESVKARAATATAVGGAANQAAAVVPFLTRPYIGWHSVNSYFDHCNPDYTIDGKLCTVDGIVALKSNGVDPSFTSGYAQTKGGQDYLYYDGHNGYDIGLWYEELLAAAPGTVTTAGTDPVPYNSCYGQTVVIDHGNGFSTRYAHMSKVDVSVGQRVGRGQHIGVSGTSGCSTGPHLHFGVYLNNPWTVIDPWGWLGVGTDPYPYDQGDLWISGNPLDPLPTKPTAVAARQAGDVALVTWTPPSFDGGNAISQYQVTASGGYGQVTVDGSKSSAFVSGIPIGTPVTFTITAQTSSGASQSDPSAPLTLTASTPFYFAEGYAAPNFGEDVYLQSPVAATAGLLWLTDHGPVRGAVDLAAGRMTTVHPGDYGVGGSHGLTVTFPGASGFAERRLYFNTGSWAGSTDRVGALAPASEWDFGEGSTLPGLDDYLLAVNPVEHGPDAHLTFTFMDQAGNVTTRTQTVPAGYRSTLPVYDPALGVGRGVIGVASRVTSDVPVVVERAMYLESFDVGYGPISDGHVEFGYLPATSFSFAEGSTLGGIKEYLTLANPGTVAATASVTYYTDSSAPVQRRIPLPAHTRVTVPVDSPTLGVGPAVASVSTVVTADQPILAERPMYTVLDFGSGPVAGATDAVGRAPVTYGLVAMTSTQPGDTAYLTLLNSNSTPATVTVTYAVAGAAAPTIATIKIPAGRRHTTAVNATAEGVGPGATIDLLTLTSDVPVNFERVQYGLGPRTLGAEVTAPSTLKLA